MEAGVATDADREDEPGAGEERSDLAKLFKQLTQLASRLEARAASALGAVQHLGLTVSSAGTYHVTQGAAAGAPVARCCVDKAPACSWLRFSASPP